MRDLLNRIFNNRATKSKDDAKQRLKFLLIHDQVDLSPAQLDMMKDEILEVLKKYVEFDAENVDIKLERGDNSIALVSSVPVRRVVDRPVMA